VNYKKIILLLLLFIPFSVSAAEIPSGPIKVQLSGSDNTDSNFSVSPIYYTHSSSNMFKEGSYYITKRCIDSDGSNKAEISGKFYGAYRIRYYNSTRYIVTYKGEKYAAVCVDKGLTANHTVVCSPYEDSAISYVFANYQDRLMATDNTRLAPELAIRALSVDKGLPRDLNSVYGMQAIHDSVAGTPSGAGEYLLEVVRTRTGSKEAYRQDAALVTFANNSGTVLNEARSIYSAAQSHSGGSPSETLASLGEDVKYTVTKSGSGNALTYVVTFDRAIGADKVKVEVKGATSSSYTMVGKVLTINITRTETQCNIQIEIKFDDGAVVSDELSSSLFLCTSEKNEGQSYLVQMEAPTPGTITITNNDLCECDCPPFNETEHIQMCCTDNEPSEVIEPFIKDLFCEYKPSDEIFVNGFNNGCGTQYEVSTDITGISTDNDYCEVYCTERIHITIPDAVSSVVGMYFDLTSVNGDSKGPLFKGKRTCRELIHYDKWVEEYTDASQRALTNFNLSQKNLAYKKMYDKAITKILGSDRKGTGTVDGKANYSCSGNAPDGCLNSDGSAQGSIDLSAEKDIKCGYKYAGEAYESDYLKYVYPKAKGTLKYLDNQTSLKHNSYKGFEIVKDNPDEGNSFESTRPTGLYDVDWDDDDCGSDSSVYAEKTITCYAKCTPLPGQTTCQMSSSSEKVSNNSCGNRTISRTKPNDIQSAFDGARSRVSNAYSTTISAYDKAVGDLDTLEKYFKECDEFYDSTSLGAAKLEARDSDKNGPAYKMYNISPEVNFHYFQAHVENSNQTITPKETVVPFTVKCDHRLKKIDSSGDLAVPADETELGLEEPHYNDKNDNKIANVKSFNAKSIDYVGLNAVTGTVLNAIDQSYVKYDQKYTHDAYYEDICYSNDEDTGSYNVYPYGSINTDSEYYSTHDVSYYIEYSTLFADYETYWEFSSVGMDGRFDDNFIEHGTCSGNTNYDAPRLFCELHVESELTEISGCSQDAIIAFLDGFGNNYWQDECCDTPDCKDRSTDQLTYTFKIVDSANLFPDGGYVNNEYGNRYGYNWLDDTHGKKVLKEIQDRANHPSNSDDVYSDNNITFEFNLSSQDLALVKEYNSEHSYNDFEMDCDNIPGSGEGEIIRVEKCKSNFITGYYDEGKIIVANDASIKLGHAKLNDIRTGSGSHFHFFTL